VDEDPPKNDESHNTVEEGELALPIEDHHQDRMDLREDLNRGDFNDAIQLSISVTDC
jgi:hypothetical protein